VRIARGLGRLHASEHPAFVVVGVFDGLHRGHQYLLAHLVEQAAARSARPMVITFDHHPDELVTGSAPPLLCDPDERFARMEEAGVETVVVVHFDQRMRETTYDAFVAQLASRGPLAGFLMTPDAAFGYRREGTPDALTDLGRAEGFEVVVIPPFALEGRQVRSSEVRAAIAAGDLDLASALLGRLHTVVGTALPDGEGSVLRFELPVALPPDGRWDAMVEAASVTRYAEVVVRAGRVHLAGSAVPGKTRVAFARRAPGEGGVAVGRRPRPGA
jgi:riboflavin kinase/FMN adenylyltransferase